MQKLCRKFKIMIYHLCAAQSRSKKRNFIFQDKFLIHNHKNNVIERLEN